MLLVLAQVKSSWSKHLAIKNINLSLFDPRTNNCRASKFFKTIKLIFDNSYKDRKEGVAKQARVAQHQT